jgi:hypothetical protein
MSLCLIPCFAQAIPSIEKIKQNSVLSIDKLITLDQQAKKGDVFSQARLGQLYMSGDAGTLPDYGKAAYWLQKAADKNNPIAQQRLGALYFIGKGVTKNKEKYTELMTAAFDGLQKALKHPTDYSEIEVAMMDYDLGSMYFWGNEGINQQDLNHALQLEEAAADLGYIPSIKRVTAMYRFGIGTEINEQKAFEQNLLLADLGFAANQYEVGMSYLKGVGVKKDRQKAIQYLVKSARNSYYAALGELVKLQKRGWTNTIGTTELNSWQNITDKMIESNLAAKVM